MTAAQVLRKARALLVEGGWTRRRFTCDGRHCALGAIYYYGNPGDSVIQAAEIALQEAKPGPIGESIISWNDRQRSKEPVLAAFDLAISRAEKRGRK